MMVLSQWNLTSAGKIAMDGVGLGFSSLITGFEIKNGHRVTNNIIWEFNV